MVREYLEDKLNEKGIEMYPFEKWRTEVSTNGSGTRHRGEIRRTGNWGKGKLINTEVWV